MKFKEVILLMMAGLNANAGFVTAIAARDRGPHTLPKGARDHRGVGGPQYFSIQFTTSLIISFRGIL